MTDGYRWLLTPDMLEETGGVWFLKVVLFNASDDERLNVQFVSFITKCMFWDALREEWSTEGCQVRPLPRSDTTALMEKYHLPYIVHYLYNLKRPLALYSTLFI